MNPILVIGLACVAVGGVGLLWWLLITTEGVYLGRRVVIWLYDLYAKKYDDIKHFQPFYEHMFLAQPIMSLVEPQQAPFVLDVATGTGRLPDSLLNHRFFQGRIVGVDLSRKMLAQAAAKLADDRRQVDLLWCPAEELPFPDGTFDVVTCLESLEFMPQPAQVINEMIRVLRPGGILLLTNRIGRHFMPGKTFSEERLLVILAACDVEDVEIELWQQDYQRVWGMKGGDSPPAGARPLIEVLCCPACGTAFDIQTGHLWQCKNHHTLEISGDGVYALFPLYAA